MAKFTRISILIIIDVLLINISYISSFLIRFDFDISSAVFETWFGAYADNILQITLITVITFAVFGLYTSIWRYAGAEELFKIALASVLSSLLVWIYMKFTGTQYMPRGIYIANPAIIACLIATSRLSYRLIRNLIANGRFRGFAGERDTGGGSAGAVANVMVIGAGDACASIINEIKNHPEYRRKVAVAVDDDPAKRGYRISGVKIAGGYKKIRSTVRKYSINEIIIALPAADSKATGDIMNECGRTSCKVRIVPSIPDIIDDRVNISKLRNIDIDSLLAHGNVELNTREVSGYLEGKVVMVTGGGGSIGSELCRQIAAYRPRRLIALDIYENNVTELDGELKLKFSAVEFEPVIGSVRNKGRLEEVFQKYKPHVIFHAAGHKHVPLMEKNPKEAVLNNVIGTKNLIDLSDKYACERFVMISTNNAANPANVMGATKRAAEMLLSERSGKQRTRCSAVRFGNVLGSGGSVLPIFRKQIEAGGPVTVTHAEMTRYFMTCVEAARLIIQSGAITEGGEIFVLDMGEPVKIIDLAEKVIRMSGYTPGVDMDIKVTGLRPGENLYEEPPLSVDGIVKTSHVRIYAVRRQAAGSKMKDMLAGAGGESFEAKVNAAVEMTDGEVKEWLNELIKEAR